MERILTGLLNQKIRIVKYIPVDDGAGGTTTERVDYWQTSAEVKQMRSRRDVQANQDQLKPVTMFTMRDRKDKNVTTDMSLFYRGIEYSIQSAEPDNVRYEMLVIMAISTKLPERAE